VTPDGWLTALAGELRRHGVDPDLAGHVVAEAAAHLRDSGDPPLSAFGRPDDYAAAVVDSVSARSER
jgi:ABC-2 type transport system ATP-binding protein